MKYTTITSNKKGARVCIMAGVHGNEIAGTVVLDKLRETLNPARGEVVLLWANEKALGQNVRYIERNLNRCFYKNNTGTSYEDEIARSIMKILDTCDALLDLHTYSSQDGKPFAICEKNAFSVAQMMPVNIISTGWTTVEPGGTDDYMYSQKKIGICFESGYHSDLENAVAVAMDGVERFLQSFDIITGSECANDDGLKRCVEVHRATKHTSQKMIFSKDYRDFELLDEGAVFATRGKVEFIAGKGECIVFPRECGPVGSEAFILGSLFDEKS